MPALFDAKSYRSAKMLVAMDAVGDAAWTLWSRAILWCNEEDTDGFVPIAQLRHLTSHADPVAVAEALCDAGAALRKAGLFERTDGGYVIHDFLKHNFSKAKKDAKRQKDRERKGIENTFHADSTRNGDGSATEAQATSDGSATDSADVPPSFHGDSRSKTKEKKEKQSQSQSAGEPAGSGGEVLDMGALRRLWNGCRERATASLLPAHLTPDDLAVLGALPKVHAAAASGASFGDWLDAEFSTWHREVTASHGSGGTRLTSCWSPTSFSGWYERKGSPSTQNARHEAPARSEPYVHRSDLPLVAPIRKPRIEVPS